MRDFKSLITPAILCGGSGTRLWPLSREGYPKQFVSLLQSKSLFEMTLERVSSLGPPIFITNEDYRFFVNDLVGNFVSSSSKHQPYILLEPSGRNTAASMAISVLMPHFSMSDLILFLPSDHFIPDVDAFLNSIESGVDAANAGNIVTFGVPPSFPSSAYGYIQKGYRFECDNSFNQIYTVENFVEKPQLDIAQEMVLSGSYLWNSGIYMCQVSTLIDAFQKHAPDILSSCNDAMQFAEIDGNFIRPSKEAFLSCRSESIDYAVMENYEKIVVAPFQGVWSDVGSWNIVAGLSPTDTSGNCIIGDGLIYQSTNTYINAPHRHVVALGTANLVIVDTPDAVLVASLDRAEQVKDIVAELKKDGASQAVMHRRVARPWGWYDSIDKGERFQVKRISVKPGASLSLQMHRHRAEHWIVVKGTAKVTNGESVFLLEENQSTYIPIGAKHRLENPGITNLEMIEIQSGSYLGEDDIVRFEDFYGRS